MAAQLAGLDDRTSDFIRWKALRLGGRGIFAGHDAQDLKQEMFLECWKRSTRFNPTKSCRRTFLQRVINNRIASMIEAQGAYCRDYRLCQRSLNEPVAFARNGPREFGESISDDDYQTRMGHSSLSAYERSELQIDVARVIATLPAELAAIAGLLKSVGVVETAHQLNLPRATVYRRIADLRGVFKRGGLNLYLSRPGTASVRRHHGSMVSSVPRQVLA